MNELQSVSWHFPPCTNRHGVSRYKYDIKHVKIVETELFGEPTVIMSDIHSKTPELVKILNEYLHLDKFVVLTAGDMAGEDIFGTDGDPTPSYKYLNEICKEFYFVQGNHDLPDYENHEETKMKNKQNKRAMIKNGESVNSLIGKIMGINGIISNKSHPYKMSKYKYFEHLQKGLSKRPTILMTHETPSIYAFYDDGARYVGNEEIFKIVNKRKPKIHIYGHCHHPQFYNHINGVHYINADARVIICIPKKCKDDKLYKKEFEDLYK